MANELDKTIEELEAEVLNELEEANGTPNAPKPNATATDKMKKLEGDGATGSEDIGGSTPSTVSPPKGADASKSVKQDTTIPKKGKADKMAKAHGNPDGTPTPNKPLAMSYNPEDSLTDDEIRELCHTKDHDCATVVEHPEWGKGKPILSSHAIPDDNGYVEWYDVRFKHGIEEKVYAKDMVIEAHNGHEGMKPDDMNKQQLAATMDMMMKKMKNAKKEDMVNMVNAMYGSGMQKMGGHLPGEKKESAEDKAKKEAVEKRVKDINVKEHVDALMNGEGDLSEEFKRKAATVFEAAVKSKVREEVERLEEDYRKDLDENMVKTQEELTEKVDNYLNYVVEEWTKENELAIERGLKGEIAEDFISGLKQLFEDHYIDVPDEKYDVLEAQSQKISELEAKLNEEVEKNISFKNNNAKLVREQVISQCTGDLTEVEIEKFKSLTEDVDFTDEDSFRSKLDTLKESYFPKNQTVTETTDDVETGNAQDIDTSSSMAVYMKAIGKGVKSAK